VRLLPRRDHGGVSPEAPITDDGVVLTGDLDRDLGAA
jgi:hypothetical protein